MQLFNKVVAIVFNGANVLFIEPELSNHIFISVRLLITGVAVVLVEVVVLLVDDDVVVVVGVGVKIALISAPNVNLITLLTILSIHISLR